jgi:hypothetical protein
MYYKKNIVILAIYMTYSHSGGVQKAREVRLQQYKPTSEVKGINPSNVIQAKNGNLYIQNARAYQGSKYSPNGRASIEAGRNTNKIFIKNFKGYSRHNSSKSNGSSDAVLSVSSNSRTSIHIDNANVESNNVKLNNSSYGKKSCAGALCVQSGDKSNVLIENTRITSRSTKAMASGAKSDKICAGALCVQADDKNNIQIRNVDIISDGNNDFSVSR